MNIQVTATGYYDTLTERFALLREGDVCPVYPDQPPAPCKSKVGRGVWVAATCHNSSKQRTVFVESNNLTTV